MKKKETITVRAVALLISVALHLYAAYNLPVLAEGRSDREQTYIELSRLPEEVEKTSDSREPEESVRKKKRPPEPEPEEKEKKPITDFFAVPVKQMKLVDLGAPEDSDPEKAPENARFLSRRNMNTDRETVKMSKARTGSPDEYALKKPDRNPEPTTKDYENKPQGKKKTDSQKAAEKRATYNQDKRESPADKPAKEVAKRSPTKSKRGDSRPEPDVRTRRQDSPAPLAAPSPESEPEKSEVRIARRKAERLKNEDLEINQYDASKTYESDDGSIEHFSSDMARGKITSLNAKAFTYASFYNRINKIIRFYWEPQQALSGIRWTGTPLKTRLRIETRDNGDLVSVEVIDSCGYPVVDAASVRAVREAAPFYNVPEALLNDKDRFVYVLGFIIEAY
ncbi:MAG: TonB C-terminal domain-containing protein [bacterium]